MLVSFECIDQINNFEAHIVCCKRDNVDIDYGDDDVVTVFLLAANYIARSRESPASGADDECPQAYWDEPSKRCSQSLHNVLEEIRTSDRLISAELRLNKTCK